MFCPLSFVVCSLYFSSMPGTLYLVATPIGNLQDISLRAIETLKTVELIACEDTRHTRKLLTHFGISGRLVSYHEHNEQQRAEELTEVLSEGKSIAVVSDAGTPAICDPSFRIVQKAIEIGANVIPIPGAVAFVNALIISGLPTDSVFFGGFLPSKKGERRNRLEEVKTLPATLCFYETPHRLGKSLADCAEILGNRNAAVVRELTKLHEEIVRGNLLELAEKFSENKVKGEIVLVIERFEITNYELRITNSKTINERIGELETEGFDHKTALKKAAKEFGLSKSEAYRRVKVKGEN
ncbi:16S rRNA (cytidine(1402)-2'-O)-methyltransferase [soil metagenome]